MKESRILAVDFGEKRIGIAVTDPLNIFAYPLTTLENDSKFWDEFKKILEAYSVTKIIIGMPYKEDGKIGNVAELIIKFKDEIEKKFLIEAEFVDERYTSLIAQQRIIDTVSSKKKRKDKSLLDKNSAAIILEDYLNKLSRNNS